MNPMLGYFGYCSSLIEGACQTRAVVGPDRYRIFWANCLPCGVMADYVPGKSWRMPGIRQWASHLPPDTAG